MKTLYFILVMIFVLLGCSIKEAPPINLYRLPTPKIDIYADTSPYKHRTLKVAYPLSLKSPLSYKIFYIENTIEGYYQNSQWSNPLGKMLQGDLVELLQKSRTFRLVLPSESSVHEDMRLESIVYDFSHHVEGRDSYASVQIRFDLIDMDSGKVNKSKMFHYKEQTPTVNAKGYIEAANRALARLARDLIEWLHQ